MSKDSVIFSCIFSGESRLPVSPVADRAIVDGAERPLASAAEDQPVGRDHRQWPGPPRGAGDHVRGRRLLHRAHQREADAIAGRCSALTIAGRASDARARCLSWLRNTTVLCGGGDALETVAAGAAELFNVVRTSQQSSRRPHLLVQLRKRSCRLRRSARLPWRAACRKRGLL